MLRHQLNVLRRQVDRPAVTDDDRTLLGAIAAALPRRLRQGWFGDTRETFRAAQGHESGTRRLNHPGTADEFSAASGTTDLNDHEIIVLRDQLALSSGTL